jgi:hypothetical protein
MENTPQPTPNNTQPTDDQSPNDGTPQYGTFGHPADSKAPRHSQAPTKDGSNDNPDEFSELRDKPSAESSQQASPVEQNKDTAAIIAAHGGNNAEERAAYALDDPRYAGGDVYDLKNQPTSL